MSTAVLMILGAALTSAQSGYTRWAILGSSKLEQSGLIDLVTASLSREPGLELVERARIEAVLREQTLASALGADAAGARLKLGRLLKADALLILADERQGQEELIRIVVAECVHGARLGLERLPYTAGEDEKLAGSIARLVPAIRAQYASGIQRLIGVPPFVSKSLVPDLDSLQAQLAHILESAFVALPGTAVLEIEEARAIRRELELSGSDRNAGVVPWFVEGEYRLEGTVARGDRRIRLSLRLTDGSTVLRPVECEFAEVAALVAYLRENAVAELLQLSEADRPRTLSVEEQVTRLAARADTLARLGSEELALDVREACLLLNPDDVQQMRMLIAAHCRHMAEAPRPRWYQQESRDIRREWQARPAGWRRSLELVERLVRRRLVAQGEALSLLDTLTAAMSDFAGRLPSDPQDEDIAVAAELVSLVDAELARCTRASQQFHEEVAPFVVGLKLGEDLANPERARETLERARRYAQSRPVYLRPAAYHITAAHLQQRLHALSQTGEDALGSSEMTFRFLYGISCEPHVEHSFTPGEYVAFLHALRDSGREINQFYARYGQILYDRFLEPPTDRIPASEALAQLRALEQEWRAFSYGALYNFAVLERMLSTTTAPVEDRLSDRARDVTFQLRDAEPGEQPAAPDIPGRIHSERIHFRVQRKSGQVQLLEPLEWAGQSGFVDEWGCPRDVVPAGPACDLVWNGAALLLHRKRGWLEEVVLDRDAWFCDAKWDGRQFWVASRHKGVWVLSSDGQVFRRIGSDDGLPPTDHWLTLAALEPGRVLAAGSFGPQRRAWCAVLSITGDRSVIDVFHEATQVYHERSQRNNDPRATFVPVQLCAYWDALRGGARAWIVERLDEDGRTRLSPLVLVPEQRSVAVLPLGYGGRGLRPDQTTYCFLKRGDWLLAHADGIELVAAPGRVYPGPRVRGWLHTEPKAAFWGALLPQGGYLYAPGDRWVRIDPETLNVERLGEGPLSRPWSGHETYYGVSAHFGLLAWNELGKVYRVTIEEPEAPPTAAPSLAGPHAFTVLRSDTSAPLSDVALEVETPNGVLTGTTDANGRCAMELSGACASVFVHKAGLAPREVVLRGTPRDDVVDGVQTIRLKPTPVIGGVVRNGAGEPAENVEVRILVAGQNERGRSREYDHLVRTDATGRWQATLFPVDPRQLQLVFALPGAQILGHLQSPDDQTAARLLSREHEYVLATRGELRVRVIDLDGRPVPNASVSWAAFREDLNALRRREDYRGPSAPAARGALPEVKTCRVDSTGCAELGTAGSQYLALAAVAPGFSPTCYTVALPTEQREIQIQLKAAQPTRGRVVDEAGVPLQDVSVWFDGDPGVRALLALETTTAPDGRFAWDVTPTAATLRAYKLGYIEQPLSQKASAEGQQVVTLRRLQSVCVYGTAADAASSRPIEKFRVAWGRGRVDKGPNRQGARDFQAGQYRVEFKEGARPEALRFEAEGFIPKLVAMPASRASETEINLTLQPGQRLHGKVTLPGGAPAAGAVVLRVLPGERSSLQDGKLDASDVNRTKTDTQGAYSFPPEVGTALLVALHEQGYAEQMADESAETLDLALQAWGRIEGTCERDEREGGPAIVSYCSFDAGELRFEKRGSAETDAAGRFALRGVPPGRYYVFRAVRDAHGRVNPAERRWTMAIQVAAGAATEAALTHEGVPIRGRVVLSSDWKTKLEDLKLSGYLLGQLDEPKPENWAQMSAQERRTWQTQFRQSEAGFVHQAKLREYGLAINADGTLYVGDVAPGRYALRFRVNVPPTSYCGLDKDCEQVSIPERLRDGESAAFDLGTVVLHQQARPASAPSLDRVLERHIDSEVWTSPRWRALQISAVGLLVGTLVYLRRRKCRARNTRK